MRGLFEGWHLVVLLIIVLLLFGAKRLPDAARGLGRSMRIFKSEMKDLSDDRDGPAEERASRPAPREVEGRIVEDRAAQDRVAQDRVAQDRVAQERADERARAAREAERREA